MCGCISAKPEEEILTSVTSTAEPKPETTDQEKPWHRQSVQVYCGDVRKKSSAAAADAEEPGTSPKQDENSSHPGGTEDSVESRSQEQSAPLEIIELDSSNIQDFQTADDKCMTDELSLNSTPKKESSNKSLPSIVEESGDTSVSGQLHQPPLIAPFDPTAFRVIKRPRSLDAWENRKPVLSKARPLSYSPGLSKTKHPRSLHSINYCSPTPKDRPKSVDIESLMDSKGSDSFKLRRILTQKVTKKGHNDNLNKPSQIHHLEEGPSRCFLPSQMLTRKKMNKVLKIKEVECLRKALKRSRMKFSESLKIMLKRVEQYLEFDPLLDSNNTISNPWISDDETIWEINRDDIEVPFLMRIKKWGLSFEELLQDSRGRQEFEMFLKKEYSLENILFYQACKQLVSCPISQVIKLKEKIESEYLTTGAPREVNIDCKTLETVMNNLKEGSSRHDRYVFQPAMDHVYALMKKDSYSRFFRSDQYKDLLETAQNHYSKKRFLSFGSNRKKNLVSSSPQPRRRGSASSDQGIGGECDMAGSSYHSYSTGNLRELEDKPKSQLRGIESVTSSHDAIKRENLISATYVGSDSMIYVGQSNSPSLRRKTDEIDKNANKESRRRSNLDVPRSSGYVSGSNDCNRKSEAMAQCLALNVPKSNVVAPWDGES